jgi:glycosyltransferase involved in cell wall biosynthesis
MKVSVLIPCHNAERWAPGALDSVLRQTWKDIEVVVVNDNSTDNSAAILAKYAENGVRVITEKCGSAAKARNKAYQNSTGQFIKFFDADDLLAPESIQLQMERLNGSHTAVASSEWGRFYNDDLSTFKLNPESVWRDMDARDWLVEAWAVARPMMQPGLFLFSRPLMEHAGLWNEQLTLIDDFEFHSRLLSHASEIRFTAGARLFYRSGLAGSLSGQKSRKAVESAFQSLMLGTSHLLAERSDAAAKRACANLLQDFIYTYYPEHSDLRAQMTRRIEELGGSDLLPDGSPRFQQLRRFVGWKAARRAQRLMRPAPAQ